MVLTCFCCVWIRDQCAKHSALKIKNSYLTYWFHWITKILISKLALLLKCSVNSFSPAFTLISSQAVSELWLHPAVLMFWRYRGLLPIIRFQDFFSLCLWCVTPQSAWRVFSCGSGPSDFQTAHTQKKKKHDVYHWGKWVCRGNNDTVPNIKTCHGNYFTGVCLCWMATGHFSSCQHNKWHKIINDGVKTVYFWKENLLFPD